MTRNAKTKGSSLADRRAISEITVAGFKSISDEQRIEIRPLTILAGANSSGKSSMLQPVLLLKQTLEVSYDPGALLLNGPNVKFTSADQLLSRIGRRHSLDGFHVGMRLTNGEHFQLDFRKEHKMRFQIEQMDISGVSGTLTLWPKMSQGEIIKTGVTRGEDHADEKPEGFGDGRWEIMQERCFLEPAWVAKGPDGVSFFVGEPLADLWKATIPKIIHLPGLRGNPERVYPVSSVEPPYVGTFEKYAASIVSQWMTDNEETLAKLSADLKLLGLAGGIAAAAVNTVQIELYVGRLPDVAPTRLEDRVNIADVGIGVSQTLPILVALHAAKPGQLVYVEQPETHLHPRAQFALAQVLASAAKRGVRVVAETHSSILLLGIQTLVAEQKLSREAVKLHWFQRERDGRTVIRSAELDEAGRFGDWPEDFADVTLEAQKKYLDAAEKHLSAR